MFSEEEKTEKNKKKSSLKLHIPKNRLRDATRSASEDKTKSDLKLTKSENVPPKVAYFRSQSVPVNQTNEMIITARRPVVSRRSRRSSFRQGTAVLRSGSRRVKEATQTFVGIGKNCDKDHEKWKLRHLRYCSFRYGKLKPQLENEIEEGSTTNSPSIQQMFGPYPKIRSKALNTAIPLVESDAASGFPTPTNPKTQITPSNRSMTPSNRFGAFIRPAPMRRRRDSVARMSLKVVNAFLKGTSVMDDLVGVDPPPQRAPIERNMSFRISEHDASGLATSKIDECDMPTILEGESLQDEVFFDQTAAEEFSDYKNLPEVRQVKRHGRRIGVDRVFTHAFHRKRRVFGRGLVGEWLDRRLTRQRINSSVKRQLDSFDNHRPYFTYWITFVHILITIISISVYGIASVGFTNYVEEFTTTKTSLSRVTETFKEPQNFWIGPKTKDLIRLGAKYSPCMRRDPKIEEFLAEEKKKERESACCVRNDNSGCIQTQDCPYTFAKHMKWPRYDAPYYTDPSTGAKVLRQSGSVCGQDPRYCISQQSEGTQDQWVDDITKWPICHHPLPEAHFRNSTYDNVKCRVLGRPCCIGQEAKCEIVTEEYCSKKHGMFHPEANLCSQVNCMQDTCGLIKFLNPDTPDQIYRLWLPILMHAGVLHCLLSVFFQMTVLRDMEKLAGWLRISIIYMLSGITGNLGSAIFLPYRAEVGPAGSIFGILACLFVEVIQCWQLFSSPRRALIKLVTIACLLFFAGTLPWVDNFAHIFGFIAGFLLSFSFLPYIHFSSFDKRRKQFQVFTSFFLFLGLFATLVFFFYIQPISDCKVCKHINCIELTDDFCSNHGFQPETRNG